MTAFLPPNLLALFAPRDPIPYLTPLDKPAWLKRPWPYSGIAKFVREFEDPKETPPPTRGETRDEKTERKRKEKIERTTKFQEEQMEQWDPHNDANAVGTDAFRTLFVGRINFDTSESKLRREMELYGPIKRLPSYFRHGDEKMKAKMAEQTADFIALLVAFVARLRSQYGVNMVKSVATWSKVNILAVSKDMDPKTWK